MQARGKEASPQPQHEGPDAEGKQAQKSRKLTSTLMRTATGDPLREAGLNFQVWTASIAFSSSPRPSGFTTRKSVTFPWASTTIHKTTVPWYLALRASRSEEHTSELQS